MKKTDEKTNVMRLLDSKKIKYEKHLYVDTDAISGIEIATVLNQDPNHVFKTLVTVGGRDLPTAVRMITKNPAEFLGLKGKGSLLAGYDADLVFFGDDIVVDTVMVGGRVVEF